jgi:hypothetical protein
MKYELRIVESYWIKELPGGPFRLFSTDRD